MKPFVKLIPIILATALLTLFFIGGAALYRRKTYPTPYRALIVNCATECALSPSLVYAVIKAESNFRPDAVSKKGAVGLMQLLPETAQFVARRFGLTEVGDLKNPAANIRAGCYYLRYLKNRFSVEETALAAYNAGEGTVRAWLADGKYSQGGGQLSAIPFPETARYVNRVKKFQNKYKKLYDFP